MPGQERFRLGAYAQERDWRRPIKVEFNEMLDFIGENLGFSPFLDGGADAIRTRDPHNAIVVLYQLS
jgi:hypothetical protein